jgi:MFS transporter, NNP family, nitrate/nitrite transporter
MIPSIFDAKAQSIEDLGQAEKAHWSLDVGRADRDRGAIAVFLSFYVVCAAIAWFSYEVCNGRADRCTRVIYAPKSAR